MKGGGYIITTHRRLEGVGLAKRGQWGNLRFASLGDAEAFARSDAGQGAIAIEHELVRR